MDRLTFQDRAGVALSDKPIDKFKELKGDTYRGLCGHAMIVMGFDKTLGDVVVSQIALASDKFLSKKPFDDIDDTFRFDKDCFVGDGVDTIKYRAFSRVTSGHVKDFIKIFGCVLG